MKNIHKDVLALRQPITSPFKKLKLGVLLSGSKFIIFLAFGWKKLINQVVADPFFHGNKIWHRSWIETVSKG
jgi:hypothetical protein